MHFISLPQMFGSFLVVTETTVIFGTCAPTGLNKVVDFSRDMPGVSIHCYWSITTPHEKDFVKIVFSNLAFTGYNEDNCTHEGTSLRGQSCCVVLSNTMEDGAQTLIWFLQQPQQVRHFKKTYPHKHLFTTELKVNQTQRVIFGSSS